MRNENLFYLFTELWTHLSTKRKIHLVLIMILSVFASISEMISIASVLPFLFVLMGNEDTTLSNLPFDYKYLLDFADPQNQLIFLALFFIFVVIISGIIRILLIWMQGTFSALVGVELSTLLLDGHLIKPFQNHQNSNTSKIIATITQKTTVVVFQIILPSLSITANITITFGIVLSLFLINAGITVISLSIFAGIYFGLYILTRKRLNELSLIINENLNTTLKTLQEMLQGLKDVLIYNAQDNYKTSFNSKNLILRNAQAMSYVIGNLPKYVIETLSICVFILIVIYSSQSNGKNIELIPILGAFALAAQKLLPALNQIYSGLSSIKSSDAVFREVIYMLRNSLINPEQQTHGQKINFNENITLENVSLKFDAQENYVLKNINLKINKGDFIGISGATGSGKSSLINLLMGFYPPSQGRVTVDGTEVTSRDFKSLLENFSHVSQNLFLCDGSIKDNIAFGIASEEIDYRKLKQVIKIAQLENFIQRCPDGLQTQVGELGAKVSGGEKQRIAIARALYKNAQIIVFDEATSSLDYKIEDEIIDSIVELKGNYTIIAIAHRLYTLEKCNTVYEIKNGMISIARTN